MKKTFSLIALSGLLVGGAVAFANPPVITVDAIADMEFATFPQAYVVTGSVTHDSATGPGVKNVCRLTFFEVVAGNGLSTTTLVSLTGTTSISTYFGWSPDCLETDNWWADWSITAPGTYTVVATAKHIGANDTDDEVTVITQTPVVVSGCPAAPAIAVDYLMNTLGWKPVSGKFKSIVKLVAGQTGSNGSLWAANACESWYEQATIDFVNANI